MLEQNINIFDDDIICRADALCFLSSNTSRINGDLVFEDSISRLFEAKFHNLALDAGIKVRKNGTVCQVIRQETIQCLDYSSCFDIIAFPVKFHRRYKICPELIFLSGRQLMKLIEENKYNKVYIPKIYDDYISWDSLKIELSNILDDRVIVCLH